MFQTCQATIKPQMQVLCTPILINIKKITPKNIMVEWLKPKDKHQKQQEETHYLPKKQI